MNNEIEKFRNQFSNLKEYIFKNDYIKFLEASDFLMESRIMVRTYFPEIAIEYSKFINSLDLFILNYINKRIGNENLTVEEYFNQKSQNKELFNWYCDIESKILNYKHTNKLRKVPNRISKQKNGKAKKHLLLIITILSTCVTIIALWINISYNEEKYQSKINKLVFNQSENLELEFVYTSRIKTEGNLIFKILESERFKMYNDVSFILSVDTTYLSCENNIQNYKNLNNDILIYDYQVTNDKKFITPIKFVLSISADEKIFTEDIILNTKRIINPIIPGILTLILFSVFLVSKKNGVKNIFIINNKNVDKPKNRLTSYEIVILILTLISLIATVLIGWNNLIKLFK